MAKVKKKSKKLKKSKSRILYIIAGLLAAIFIFTAGTMAIMVKDEIENKKPPESDKEPHLYVEDVFFMKADSRSNGDDEEEEKIDIITTVYITNDGMAKAKDVKIIARPIDENKNLAQYKTDKLVGTIPVEKTSEIEFTIKVPSGAKHNVDLMIFEDGKLILRGSGSVVIEGSNSNTPKYKTYETKGTGNDSDYDGMPDNWERYYGLDPSNPEDANDDADHDGLSNLDEFRGGSPPCAYGGDPDEKEEAGMYSSSSMSLIGVVIIIIVIVVIVIVLIIGNVSKQENKNNKVDNTHSPWPNPNNPYNSYYTAQPHTEFTRCSKCGGWVNKNMCLNCGTAYPVKTPPSGDEKQEQSQESS